MDFEIPQNLSAAGLHAEIKPILGDAFDGVHTVRTEEGRRLRVLLTRALSGDETTALQGAIAAHSGAPPARAMLLGLVPALLARSKPLETINYQTELLADVGRLHPQITSIVDGEVRQKVFWRDFDGVTYSTPVVTEDFVYTRNAQSFVMFRVQTIRWHDEAGALMADPVKARTKFYSPEESISEGKRRRGNIVNGLELIVLEMMQATIPGMSTADLTAMGLNGLEGQALADAILELGRDFLRRREDALRLYADAHVKLIHDEIRDAAEPQDIWLDNIGAVVGGVPVPVRTVIISKLV